MKIEGETFFIDHPLYHYSLKGRATDGYEKGSDGKVVKDEKGKLKFKVTSKNIWRTLVFRPGEYKEVTKRCDRNYKIIFDVLLYTGMRYEEIMRLRQHEEWFDPDNRKIFLPPEAQKKVKRAMLPRTISLSYQGKSAVENLFDIRLPMTSVIDQYIYRNFGMICPSQIIELSVPKKTRWGTEITHYTNHPFSLKSFRKTYESWLLTYYTNREMAVAQSQGHNTFTQFDHYLVSSFTERDRLEMKEFVEGWL